LTARIRKSLLCLLLALTALSFTGCIQTNTPQEAGPSAAPSAADATSTATPSPEAENTEDPKDTAASDHAEADIDFTDLDACVSQAIIDYNKGHYLSGEFQTESHVTLKTIEDGGTATVYLMAYYAEFDFTGGDVTQVSGSHIPVAITFSKDADGAYTMTEYWEASDGGGYAASIKEKFPADVAEQALDTQVYVEAQSASCYEKAKEYFKNR
jgi:predicted small secreted protein